MEIMTTKVIDTVGAEKYILSGENSSIDFGDGVLIRKNSSTLDLEKSKDGGATWEALGSGGGGSGLPLGAIIPFDGDSVQLGFWPLDGESFNNAHQTFTGDRSFADYVMGKRYTGTIPAYDPTLKSVDLITSGLSNVSVASGNIQAFTDMMITVANPSSDMSYSSTGIRLSTSSMPSNIPMNITITGLYAYLPSSFGDTVRLQSYDGTSFITIAQIPVNYNTPSTINVDVRPGDRLILEGFTGTGAATSFIMKRSTSEPKTMNLMANLVNSGVNVNRLITLDKYTTFYGENGYCPYYGVDFDNDILQLPNLPRFFMENQTQLSKVGVATLDQVQEFTTRLGYGDSNSSSVGGVSPQTKGITWDQTGSTDFGFSNYGAKTWNANLRSSLVQRTGGNGYDETKPRSLEVSYQIKVADVASGESSIDIPALMTALDNKAEKTFSNIDSDSWLTFLQKTVPDYSQMNILVDKNNALEQGTINNDTVEHIYTITDQFTQVHYTLSGYNGNNSIAYLRVNGRMIDRATNSSGSYYNCCSGTLLLKQGDIITWRILSPDIWTPNYIYLIKPAGLQS